MVGEGRGGAGERKPARESVSEVQVCSMAVVPSVSLQIEQKLHTVMEARLLG